MILEPFRTLVHALLLVAAQVSARHASNLSVRDEVGVDQPHERWQHYADNGIRFWFEWRYRGANVPDAPLLSGIDDLLHPRYDEPSLNERTEVVIAEELKVPLDCAHWQSVHMSWEPQKTEQERQLPREQQPKDTDFVCSVDAEDGLFVIELSYRGRLPLRFSQLAWWVWQRETARKGLPASGLRTILVEDTVSDDTNLLLDWALRNERLDADYRDFFFTPDNLSTKTNPFWALLGSPSGTAIIHMLTEYKQALGGKGILFLRVRWSEKHLLTRVRNEYIMWFAII